MGTLGAATAVPGGFCGCFVTANLEAKVAKPQFINLSFAPASTAITGWMSSICTTYLFLLLVKIVNDDTDEEVQCEERPEDDEYHKVQVHV